VEDIYLRLVPIARSREDEMIPGGMFSSFESHPVRGRANPGEENGPGLMETGAGSGIWTPWATSSSQTPQNGAGKRGG